MRQKYRNVRVVEDVPGRAAEHDLALVAPMECCVAPYRVAMP